MATPHLTSSLPAGKTGANNRKLNASAGHLLILKKTTTWTNKTFVLTPVDEHFATAVVYADYSAYNTGYGQDVVADTDALAGQFSDLWNSKTGMGAWTAGHKPLVTYYARGWGPWAIKSKPDINRTHGIQILEYGGSRQLLRFKTHALPVGNLSSFNAYLRFWNPSFGFVMPTEPGGSNLTYLMCSSISHNNCGHVRYHFDSEAMPPTQMNAEGYGEIDLPPFANEGKGTAYWNGSLQFGKSYDVWGTHLGTASGTDFYDLQKTAVYLKGKTQTGGTKSNDPYYHDAEITGNGLKRLKECLPNGDVHLIIGSVPANGITSSPQVGLNSHSTLTLYTSRIELIFKCSGGKINQ